MSDPSVVYSQDIPDNKLQGRTLSNFSLPDLAFTIVSAGFIYLAFQLLPLAAIFVALLAVILFFRPPKSVGRMYRQVALELKGNYIEGALGGVLWQADESVREKRFAKYLRGRHSALPYEFAQVKAVIDGKLERFGMLRQLDRSYDILFLKARGGNFANMGNSDESRGVSLLTSVMNSSTLQNTDMKVGSSYVSITTPSNPYQLSTNLRGKIDPIIQFPEKFDLSDDDKEYAKWQRENIDEWLPAIATIGSKQSWQLIAVTIKRPFKTRLKLKVANITNQQIVNLPIIELARTIVEGLQNADSLGLTDIHAVGLAELAEINRAGWDPFGMSKYFELKAKGLVPTNDDEIDAFIETHKGNPELPRLLDGYLQAHPSRIIQIHKNQKCVQFDDNFISTIRITKFPETIRADQVRMMLYKLSRYGWIRRSMVAESVSADKETRMSLIGQSALINVEQAMNNKKIVQDPRLARRRQKKQDQTNVISSQSIVQLFNYLWTVVCPNLESSVIAQREIVGYLRSKGFDAKVVSQPALFIDAAISGMYGVNRL